LAKKWKSAGLLAAAGLFVIGGSVSAQACAANSFTIVNPVGGGDPGFQWIKSNGNQDASLTLTGSSTPVTSVTFDFMSMPPTKAFEIVLLGFKLLGGASSYEVAAKDSSLHTLTFYSVLAGGVNDLKFIFSDANPNSIEIGHLVVNPSKAPAPIPGAGFLSFLALGFARFWKGGKETVARVIARRSLASA
jgi:hypothetical protein